MGKSEIQSMPLHRPETSLICDPTACKAAYITNVIQDQDTKKDVKENHKEDKEMPKGLEIFSHQVAGHVDDGNGNYIGMLRENGVVLKPIFKKECGEREIYFYKSLEDTVDKTLIELRGLVPKFYGIQNVAINSRSCECIVLEDLTKHFKEPCIMDIKIGKRTWDPKATYEKIIAEEKKYHDCKRDLGFCIPGFQVYSIYDNRVFKYGKEFGKLLNKERAIDAIKTFLNADKGEFCRSLIVQFLATLWRIQHWARNQRRLRLYSSSVLLVYDARRLREHINNVSVKSSLKLNRKGSLYRPMSIAILNKDSEQIPTGFSGQLTIEGPILKLPTPPNKMANLEVPTFISENNTWQKSMHTLKRTHSFQNNYDKDVLNRKQSYTFILDDLCSEQKSEYWAIAKMIDFAHVYPAENCNIDTNYLDGIDNLIKLFEDFLAESD